METVPGACGKWTPQAKSCQAKLWWLVAQETSAWISDLRTNSCGLYCYHFLHLFWKILLIFLPGLTTCIEVPEPLKPQMAVSSFCGLPGFWWSFGFGVCLRKKLGSRTGNQWIIRGEPNSRQVQNAMETALKSEISTLSPKRSLNCVCAYLKEGLEMRKLPLAAKTWLRKAQRDYLILFPKTLFFYCKPAAWKNFPPLQLLKHIGFLLFSKACGMSLCLLTFGGTGPACLNSKCRLGTG